MEKEVLLRIKGLQFEQGASEEEMDQIETICPGEYYYRNDAHFLLYEELVEGFEVPIKNMIKCKEHEIIITKKGPLQVQMVFEEGKKTLTEYGTPYGRIMIGLDTTSIEVKEEEDELIIHIQYGLEANYQFVADCDITIKAESHKKSFA